MPLSNDTTRKGISGGRPNGRRSAVLILLLLMLTPIGLSLLAQATKHSAAPKPRQQKVNISPQIPKADRRDASRIFLDHADILNKMTTDSFMVLTGNVAFSKGAMHMYCDSAHYYPDSESMDAFGNVRMQQGDTLFIYADELNYRGGSHAVAYLYGYDGKPVRMINRDVKLETQTFTYDLFEERGFYTTGGVLTDPLNRLISDEGEYIPATKEANFYNRVWLKRTDGKDTLDIYTDTLNYNTQTHVAEFYSPTEIVNNRGTINSNAGVYNTFNNQTELFSRSTVVIDRGPDKPKSTFTGDTIFYDRNAGFGQAFGNVVLVDSVREASLLGQYGFYDQVADSAFFTGNALAKEYSQGDTLYIHGRYIKSKRVIDSIAAPSYLPSAQTAPKDSATAGDSIVLTAPVMVADTTHTVTAWPRVRFYRSDMQGLCDSMTFVQRDSTLYLDRHPIVWSDDRQIFGNVMQLHLNDSTIDHALLPDFGFTAQHIEDDYYNQLTGKRMEAWFEGGELSRLHVSNSVDAIFYPEENDSTINKFVNLQTANMQGWFEKRALTRMKCWPESSGQATPLYLSKKSMLFLPKFQWFASLRPDSPASVFDVSAEMDELMEHSPIPYIPIPEAPDMRYETVTRPVPPLPQAPAPPAEGEESGDENADSQPAGLTVSETDAP